MAVVDGIKWRFSFRPKPRCCEKGVISGWRVLAWVAQSDDGLSSTAKRFEMEATQISVPAAASAQTGAQLIPWRCLAACPLHWDKHGIRTVKAPRLAADKLNAYVTRS